MLSRKTFFVKERVAFVKLTDAYDIFDPETQQQLGHAMEEPATWAKYLRLLVNKSLLPTTVNVYQNGDETPLFSIHRPFVFLRSKIRVTGPSAQPFGYFKSKMTGVHPLTGALKVMLIGAVAAAAAYGVAKIFEG